MPFMNAKNTLLASLGALTLLAGCTSTGPNTERGAATGAALGALGGAVIGNNTGSGHTAAGAAIGAAAGAVAGGMYGNRRDREQGTAQATLPPTDNTYGTNTYGTNTYGTNTYGATTGTVVQQPPPTPTSEPQDAYTPQPAPNTVWIRGHYDYTGDGQNYRWMPGHWETPPPGTRNYVPGHWQQQANGYSWVPGTWQ